MQGRSTEPDEVFQSIRSQIQQLMTLVSQNEERKKRMWKDDAEVLEAYVSALSSTKTVLKEEQTKVTKKIEKWEKKHGQQSKGSTASASASVLSKSEVQEKLNEFRQRVKEAEARVEQAVNNLSTAVRLEERCMLEDQIAIMGETRKLCLEEAKLLEVMLREIEAAEQIKKEQSTDWEELAYLNDQLSKLESKIDQAKRCLLFPTVHGYRFRVGTGGIYVGAKDLNVSDMSGGFSLSVESIKQSDRSAVIKMLMGGREPRPPPLTVTETDSYDGSVVVLSPDVNEINSPPLTSPHSPKSEDMKNETGEDPGIEDESQDSTIDPAFEQMTDLELEPPAIPAASNIVEAGLSAVEHQIDNTEETDFTHDAVHSLQVQRASSGKNFAVKFLKRLSDRKTFNRSRARPPALLQAIPSRRRMNLDSRPSFKNSLLKKFALTSPDPPQAHQAPEEQQRVKATSQLNHSATPRTSTDSQNMHAMTQTRRSTGDIASLTTKAPGPMTENPAASKETATLRASPTPHNRRGSLDRIDFPKKQAPRRWFESKSESQSDTTSIAGAGRRGVFVKLQGAHVSVIGEKGTRVPNITARDITLEVECRLSVTFEFSEQQGWHSPDGLKFEIIQLRKQAIGNSIPLPAGLVKTLLNLILPKVVERALLSVLPKELGMYILESQKGLTTAGEVIAVGPPLCAIQAQLNTPSPYANARSRAADLKAYCAVQEAQNLLSLTQDQAMLLGECFSKDKWGLLDPADGWTGACTITELCRFYDRYNNFDSWTALCELWNKAVQHVASVKKVDCSIDFAGLMNGSVARLAAKPVRTQCFFTRLNSQLNVDVFLMALRDYCERSARELHADKTVAVALPLDQQLQDLREWYSQTKTRLTSFKTNFKSFMSAVVARADARSLQIGLEKARYEGPLNFQLPIVRDQVSELLSFDVSIPAPGDTNSSEFIDSLSRALRAIHVFKQASSQDDSATESRGEEQELEWGISSATGDKLAKALHEERDEEHEVQFNQALSLGRAFLRRLQTSVTLNEDVLAKHILKDGVLGVGDLKTVLENVGDVIAGDLRQDPDQESSRYTLSFQSSNYARFKCLVDTLGFQSTVSPAEVFSMIHICIREYLSTFCKEDTLRLREADQLFHQIIKTVDKRSLDVVICSKLESGICDDRLIISLNELDGSENSIRFPIQITNDFDLSSLMDSLTDTRGKLGA